MCVDDSLGFLLGRALRLHQQRSYQRLGHSGLHPGQAPVMFALWHQDGQVQKDLAARLHLTPATVTVTVRRLEKAGLVERRRDASDQRISRVYLTERGRTLRRQVAEAVQATDAECLAGFTPEEVALLRSFLARMAENLQHALQQSD